MAQQSTPKRRRRIAAVAAALAATFAGATTLAGSGSAQAGPSARAAAQVRVVTYRGHGVSVRRASHQLSRLEQTSPRFQKAVSHRLTSLWKQRNDARPKCATAPVIIVKKWRSDGWAWIDDLGTFDPCPTGGNWEIWRARHGVWRSVLGGQDLPYCRQLRHHHVPEGMWNTCYTATGKVVRYTGP